MKKGISTDVLVIILLLVGLVIFVLLFLKFGGYGKTAAKNLSNISAPLKRGWGVWD